MNWTKKPPTEPGWYWWCTHGLKAKPFWVFVDGRALIQFGATAYPCELFGGYWLPLPEPETPEVT